jgi:chemotaxis protein MotB
VHRFPTNWDLSAVRAIAVVRYLTAQGIDPNQISAVAFVNTIRLHRTTGRRDVLYKNRRRNIVIQDQAA